jgi:hypothetical protein
MMRMFQDWCALNNEKAHQATPALVARFVRDIAPMGISKVWREVQDVSRSFYVLGLADPTLGGPVAAAVNEISKIPAPRSWPAEEKARFLTLPFDIQSIILKRETDRDKQIRHMQNEFATLKQKESEYADAKTTTEHAA